MTTTPSDLPEIPTVSLFNDKLIVPHRQVRSVISIRISAAGNSEAYENQHATAETVFRDLPDAHLMLALPREVRAPGKINDHLRTTHGVIPLDYSDVPHSGGRRTRLGYAFLGGSILWLFIMNSAAEGNLPAWPGDSTDLGRNAFTELVANTAVALYETGSSDLALRFAFWSRMDREDHHGSRLRAVVRRRPGMSLWDGNRRVDLHDPSSQIVNAVSSGLSNASILEFKAATYIGNLNHLAENKWEKPESFLPLGYRFRRETNAEGFTTTFKGEVVVDDTWKPAVKELSELAANGATWKEVGRRAAELRVPLRSVSAKGKTFASLDDEALGRAAKMLFGNPSYISVWRNGTRVVRRRSMIDGAEKVRGRQLSFEDGNSRGYVDTVVTWPLPPGGWGVAEDVWTRIADRLAREADRASRVKTPSGVAACDRDRRAFSGSPTWRAGEHEFRLRPETPTAYRLRRRDAKDGKDGNGSPRGWRKEEGDVIAVVNGMDLHSSMSRELEAALRRLVDGGAEIGPIPVLSVASARRHDERRRQLSHLVAEADELERRAVAFDELAVTAQLTQQAGQAERYVTEAASARERATAKREEASRAGALVESGLASGEPVVLNLADPMVVAVALRRFPQHVPAPLVDALARLGITDSLRLVLGDDETTCHWCAVCHIPIAGEDAHAVIPIQGVVPNVALPRGRERERREGVAEAQARLLLVDQAELADVAEMYHEEPSRISVRVKTWLRAHGVRANGLANAAMECPIAETRRCIFYACAGDEDVIRDLAPAFVEHVKSVYLGDEGMMHWTPGPMRPQRLLLRALSTAGDCIAIKHDVAASLGLTPRDVARIARGWDGHFSIVDRRGYQELRLRRCPHPDCSGSPGRLTEYLVTPETRKGLLCAACRRSPESPHVVFPTTYLKPWEGPKVRLGATSAPVLLDSERLLTTREAASQLGRSTTWVSKTLTPARKVGNSSYFHPAEVQAKLIEIRSRRTIHPTI